MPGGGDAEGNYPDDGATNGRVPRTCGSEPRKVHIVENQRRLPTEGCPGFTAGNQGRYSLSRTKEATQRRVLKRCSIYKAKEGAYDEEPNMLSTERCHNFQDMRQRTKEGYDGEPKVLPTEKCPGHTTEN